MKENKGNLLFPRLCSTWYIYFYIDISIYICLYLYTQLIYIENYGVILLTYSFYGWVNWRRESFSNVARKWQSEFEPRQTGHRAYTPHHCAVGLRQVDKMDGVGKAKWERPVERKNQPWLSKGWDVSTLYFTK